jgi:uncharacterized integral membrane protein
VARDYDGSAARRRGPSPRLLAAGLLLVLAVVFVFENTEQTEIRFVLPKVQTPLWVALAVTMIVGVVVGFLLGRSRDR